MNDELFKLLVFFLRFYNIVGLVLMLYGFLRHYKIFASERLKNATEKKVWIFGVGLMLSAVFNVASYISGNLALFLAAGFFNATIIYLCAFIVNHQARRLERLRFAPQLEAVQRAIDEFFHHVKKYDAAHRNKHK